MTRDELPVSAAGALLRRLKRLGVDVVFVNSGTDFPPIAEALAEAEAHDTPMPAFVLAAHEHIAMSMAHGYYAATGRAQAVILHTNVGLANGAIGAINAAVDQVPLLLMSGRTPATERDRFGSRTVPIGWGQEMRDQTALVREASKWDYELRFPEQVPELLDRAHAIANSTPKGPVYLSLPREVLSEPCPPEALTAPIAMQPAVVETSARQIEHAARLLVQARNPLIIAQRGAGTEAGFEALARIADELSIPVCQYWAVANAISSDHPLNVGSDPSPWVESADVILVVDSLAPWAPDQHRAPDDCVVIQMGPDPLFERFPVRNFPSQFPIRGEVGPALVALADTISRAAAGADPAAGSGRRSRILEWNVTRRAAVKDKALSGNGDPMSKEWVSHCLGQAISRKRATVVSELGCPLEPLALNRHESWRQEPHAGGLGWGLPYSMGLQLADPDRLTVATMGDGSYLFANPVACHRLATFHDIALLVLVLNNGRYGAVSDSVLGLYPDGYAAKSDNVPLTSLAPSQGISEVAAACGAHAESVSRGEDLPGALERALTQVIEHKRQALLEVIIA